MSLLGSQGGRNNEKTIKETLLNEEIAKLREIYQDTSTASEKVLAALRKIIDFNRTHNQPPPPPQDNTLSSPSEHLPTLNYFMDELSAIEDSLITLIENCEADKEQFVSAVIFRDSDKQLATGFFRQMMRSHQQFKERLNLAILRLEKDIQTLESNGFHIYSTTPKPNNVLGTLKKHTLDKFITSLAEMHTVFAKMKAQMGGASVEKKPVRADFKNEVQKMREYCKLAHQIALKEKLTAIMLAEEINTTNQKIVNETNKIKSMEQAIKINRTAIGSIHNQLNVLSPNTPFSKAIFNQYIASLKESVDKHMLFTPKLYKAPAQRSKSCHTIITAQSREDVKKEESGASDVTIIGADFLEESVQN